MVLWSRGRWWLRGGASWSWVRRRHRRRRRGGWWRRNRRGGERVWALGWGTLICLIRWVSFSLCGWLAGGEDGAHAEVCAHAGTGTFGKVILSRLRLSLATRPTQTQPHYFAMKVLEKVTVVRLRQVEHLNSERATLAYVSHPFIVNLYVFGFLPLAPDARADTICDGHRFCTFQDEANLYLLLEYVQGGELFSHLRRAGRFSPDVARFYAANLILALEYLHSQDIIYRDLKPENLLIDSTVSGRRRASGKRVQELTGGFESRRDTSRLPTLDSPSMSRTGRIRSAARPSI